MASAALNLTVLGRRLTLHLSHTTTHPQFADREIASSHRFIVVEIAVLRGAWGHSDPPSWGWARKLVPGKWLQEGFLLLLGFKDLRGTWRNAYCGVLISRPQFPGADSQILNLSSVLPGRFDNDFKFLVKAGDHLCILCPLHLSGGTCINYVNTSQSYFIHSEILRRSSLP